MEVDGSCKGSVRSSDYPQMKEFPLPCLIAGGYHHSSKFLSLSAPGHWQKAGAADCQGMNEGMAAGFFLQLSLGGL